MGNNRISYAVDPSDNVLKILEEDHYYPFGLKHNGYSANQQMMRRVEDVLAIVPVTNPGDVTYKYMYLGQKRQDELGLSWDTFRYRNYDNTIGRFFGIGFIIRVYPKLTGRTEVCLHGRILFMQRPGIISVNGLCRHA